MRLRALLVFLVCGLLSSASASAQIATARPLSADVSQLDPTVAAMLLVAHDAAAPSRGVYFGSRASERAEAQDADKRTLHSGQRLIAAGSGLVAGSALALLMVGGRRYCAYQGVELTRTAPRVAGAVFGTIGIGLDVLGFARLRSVSDPARRHLGASPGRTFGLVMIAVGVSAATMGAVIFTALPESVQCWSS